MQDIIQDAFKLGFKANDSISVTSLKMNQIMIKADDFGWFMRATTY